MRYHRASLGTPYHELVHVDTPALVDGAQEAATAAWRRFVAKYGRIMAR